MDYRIEPLVEADRFPVLDIFNYYVDNSFAAFPDQQAPPAFFDSILELALGYPALAARTGAGEVAGFAFLRAFLPFSTLRRTAQSSIFLAPGHAGKGLGTRLLAALVQGAVERDVDSLVAAVSSLNGASLNFHAKHGYVERGRIVCAGRKFGKDFDLVWMQRRLEGRV